MHTNSRLAASNSIAQHTICGLIRAIKEEKRKRNRGKRLNLVGEEDNGPQVFTPSRVLWAKAHSDELKAQEVAERARIDNKKVTALANKIQKEREHAAQALHTSIHRQEVAEKKTKKAVEVQAQKDQHEVAKQACKAQKAQKTTQVSAPKCKEAAVLPPKSSVVAVIIESPVKVTSRGRVVKLPTKLSTWNFFLLVI